MADEKWNFKKFAKKFRIVIIRMGPTEMEFDLIGIQPAFANAFRRLMLSEVPSMSIEKVLIKNNTSIIQDEVLAHRLGLIPLRADPRLFEYRPEGTYQTIQDRFLELAVRRYHNWCSYRQNSLERHHFWRNFHPAIHF